MKLTSRVLFGFAGVLIGLNFHSVAGETNAPSVSAERIGTYDSRVIAYANFVTEAHLRKLNAEIQAARAAQAAGQTNRCEALRAALKEEQDQGHLQVFSTAPVDDILASMPARIEAVKKEAVVTRLVSKWDVKTLKELKSAEQVEVTELLLREFTLDEKQQKIVADLRAKPPVPLEKAKELMRGGKL